MISCYIDPGTGSMLFSIVIGLVTALYFLGKAAIIKLKFIVSGGKAVISKKHTPLVIYSEDKRYWNVFKPILEVLEKREIATVYYVATEDDPVFSFEWKYISCEIIGEGNKAFARLNFLEADMCLMTTPGLDVYQLKRSKGVKHYSHILHAPSDASTYRLYGLDYFDSVLLTGEYQKDHVRILEQNRKQKEKDLLVVGCTYLDELQKKVAELPSSPKAPFTVLLSPSWGTNAILTRYGTELLDPLLQTGFHVIVRPHPQTRKTEQHILEPLVKRYEDAPNLEWDYNSENLLSLSRADIMISDFSGIIFDYIFLFNRPVLYVNQDFDWSPFDSYEIEETPWMFRVLPEIGFELQREHFNNIEAILKNAVGDVTFSEGRIKARETAWQHRGESAERVVNYLLTQISAK